MIAAGMDETDATIVSALRINGRATLSKLSCLTGMSASAVQSRIQKLERRGVITAYRAEVDYEHVGLPISAFISVIPLEYSQEMDMPERLKQLEGVVSCYSVTGEASYMLLVRVASPAALEDLIGKIHQAVPVSTRSQVILKPYFENLF
ncbi:Lrp/AsnC family transcriptional regulator [Bifidobacterium lemurum]|nr:Lrp/AsnC family transcriptional regulator [Bifidobacterium lemurum]